MVNGQKIILDDDSRTLSGLLQQLGYCGDAFAVALNGDFVARTTYGEVALGEGDRLDIVAPMVGG